MSDTYVGVVGPGSADAETTAIAEELGAELGRRSAVVVCGGLGGTMEAVCRGAKSTGGLTLGLLPGLDRSVANSHVDVAIPTGLGELRNGLIVRAADVLIAVRGEFGTLSEVSFALKTGVPVVGIDTWELHKGGRASEAIVRVGTPAEAVDAALALAQARGA